MRACNAATHAHIARCEERESAITFYLNAGDHIVVATSGVGPSNLQRIRIDKIARGGTLTLDDVAVVGEYEHVATDPSFGVHAAARWTFVAPEAGGYSLLFMSNTSALIQLYRGSESPDNLLSSTITKRNFVGFGAHAGETIVVVLRAVEHAATTRATYRLMPIKGNVSTTVPDDDPPRLYPN